jgi:hypothetical protein
MSLHDMQTWVQNAFPRGKWENAQHTDWLISSPFREDRHPSFSINLEKRVCYDRATNETYLLSELCQKLGLPEPDRKGEDLPSRTQEPTINKNALIAGSRWNKAQQADDSFPYLKRKGVPSYGLRTDTDGTMGQVLLIPAYDVNNQIVGLERISGEGEKRHLGQKREAFHLIGKPGPGEQVFIAEGYATACSIHQITGSPVAVSFSAFNLPNVARILKEKGYLPTICPDSGASEVTGFRNIKMPGDALEGQDWNDLHRELGLDEARRMFREQESKSTTCTEDKEERATFKIKKMSARELYQTPLASPSWAIDQMIPSGLSVIASPPKVGKSYFVLQAAFAVARGEKFLGYRTTKGKVLLISLEDTFSRLQKRIVQVCPDTSKIPDNLDMTVEFPRLDSEGLACLEKEIKENGYSLVIVDTWGKSKPNGQAKRSENVYETDVRLVSEVKKLADKYGISILLVHHLKKGGGASKDWLESLSGSMGLSATVDGLLALERERGSDIGILKRSGRDLEDDEDIGLNWLAPCWEFNGSAAQMKLNASKQKILTCIEKASEPVKPSYVATDTGINANTVRYHLSKMLQEGLIAITSDSKYMLPPKKEIINGDDDDVFTNSTNSTNSTNTANSTNSPNSTNNTNSCDFTKTNRMTNSCKDSDTIDLKPSVCPVGLVGHIEEDSTSSGSPTEFEEIIINTSFKKQEYSEAQAQNWLDNEAPPEAKRLFQEKFDRMHATIKDEALCREKALLRTWEHYHRGEVA